MKNKWVYFVYVILFWLVGVPILYFCALFLIFRFLPDGLDLAILPIIFVIVGISFIIYIIGFIASVSYVRSIKLKYAFELNSQKKLSSIFYIFALIAPIILLMVYYGYGYIIGKKTDIYFQEKQRVYDQEERVKRDERKQDLDIKYEEYKKQVEGEHVITHVTKREIDNGNYLMIITLDNNTTFTIAYWFSDWIARRFPLAIPDGRTFSKRNDVLGKKFTFTFYDRETFESIFYEQNQSIQQILPPKEARSGNY